MKPGLLLPEMIESRATTMDKGAPTVDKLEYTVWAIWNAEHRRYAINRVEVESVDGTPVTTANFRRVKPVQSFEKVALYLTEKRLEGGGTYELPRPDAARAMLAARSDSNWLVEVARAYAVFRATTGRGLQETADLFGVSQSTVTRWVNTARTRGLLDG